MCPWGPFFLALSACLVLHCIQQTTDVECLCIGLVCCRAQEKSLEKKGVQVKWGRNARCTRSHPWPPCTHRGYKKAAESGLSTPWHAKQCCDTTSAVFNIINQAKHITSGELAHQSTLMGTIGEGKRGGGLRVGEGIGSGVRQSTLFACQLVVKAAEADAEGWRVDWGWEGQQQRRSG